MVHILIAGKMWFIHRCLVWSLLCALVVYFLLERNDAVWKSCRRLGELLRQEQERVRAMKMEGHAIYQQYVQQGHDAKISKQVKTSSTSYK